MSDVTSSNANTSEEDLGVSMIDILAEEERLKADAHAVLGDSDDKNCTYSRVAFYSGFLLVNMVEH